MPLLSSPLAYLRHTARRFATDRRGNIAMMVAVAAVMIVTGVGAGIDLARALSARQRLSETAVLACQFANRPSINDTANATYSGSNGGTTYVTKVNAFISASLTQQHFQWAQTNATPFTYTQGGPANVTLTASVPTSFMQLIHVTTLPIAATSHCYDNTNQGSGGSSGSVVVSEGFENSACAGTCYVWYATNGTVGTTSTPVNTFSSTVGYTGTSGTKWYIMGYCLEVDSVGIIESSVAEGTHSAELDCDNGQGTAGNSSISTQTYLTAGNYELRYNYVSRVDYWDYDPTYICGSVMSDVSWASDTALPWHAANTLRTNQINVYLDQNSNGQPPTHTTMDGTQTLGGSNLIDVCAYAKNWIQRSVRIKVTQSGYYWLSFAADGTSDSYGGQLDNVMLCVGSCSGTLQDNFPPSWLAANNGGVNKVLFEDPFENAVYTQDPYTSVPHAKGGNLVNSPGTTVNTLNCGEAPYTYASPPGWPCLQPSSSPTWANGYVSGWATGPVNEVMMNVQGAYQGSQYVALMGWNGFSSGTPPVNRAISRPFLLDPGYYQISYDYISNVDYSPSGIYGTTCYAAPGSGFIFSASYPGLTGTPRWGSPGTGDGTANILGVFMSNGQLVSTPINSGATLGSTTSYTNPDGTVTTTPKVPPDNVNWASYNASVANPVIDVCGYADSYRWVPRSVSVLISKPGIYWLTFSTNGAVPYSGTGNGAGIDDVKITALGSLYMASPPTTALTTIPFPSPQPSTTISYTGFFIVGDPLMAPAPPQ